MQTKTIQVKKADNTIVEAVAEFNSITGTMGISFENIEYRLIEMENGNSIMTKYFSGTKLYSVELIEENGDVKEEGSNLLLRNEYESIMLIK